MYGNSRLLMNYFNGIEKLSSEHFKNNGANTRRDLMIEFTVPGEPVGKQRPRVVNGHAYTPRDTVIYENWVRQCFNTCDNKILIEGQILATIDCYYAIPKSTSNKNREAMYRNAIRPTKKPDIDNVAKSILDSLNGMAYKDDSQVVECIVRKWYADEPKVKVKLMEV